MCESSQNLITLALPMADLPATDLSHVTCGVPQLGVLDIHKPSHSGVTEKWRNTGKKEAEEKDYWRPF